MIDREAIYAALWARVSAPAGLKTKSRRLKHWADVSPEQRPALFLAVKGQEAAPQTGKPTIWRLTGTLYLYLATPDPVVPGTALNGWIDTIAATLAPDVPTGRCSLGDLVHCARISGEIETDEGTLGDTAVALIPIEILATD